MPLPERLSAVWMRATRGALWATPGQLDAGLASLATFVTGLYAVRHLGNEALGAYSLLFSTFLVASQVPTELIFAPSQVLAIDLEPRNRLGLLRHSMRRGAFFSIASAIVVPLGALPVYDLVPRAELAALLVSGALLTAISPLQDHVRSTFHLSGSSWAAAATSAAHLIGTVLSLLVLQATPSAAPFGALVGGNILSICLAGVWITRQQAPTVPRPTFGQMRTLGGWLLATGVARSLFGYASRVLLNAVVGITALGQVEGARIVAHPLNVLASGLTAQVGPRAMEAASRRNGPAARLWRRRFGYLFSLIALPYAAITAFPSSLNPMYELAPRAFEVSGLTALMLTAVWINSLLRPMKSELLGARMLRSSAYVVVATGAVEVATIFTGDRIGALAAPAGLVLAAALTWVLMRRLLDPWYGSSPPDVSGESPHPPPRATAPEP